MNWETQCQARFADAISSLVGSIGEVMVDRKYEESFIVPESTSMISISAGLWYE